MTTRVAPAAEQVVHVSIDPSTVIAQIPEDFLGLGYETSAVAQGGLFTRDNARMIQLYKNLTPHGLIRIGGNVSDHTRYEAAGTAAAKTEREVTIINQASLEALGDFASATGWQVMWGLNLGTGTKEDAAEEAVAVDKALGKALHSFEIGNEVDLMRKYSRDYDAYHAAYLEFRSAIRAKLPSAVFSGPDVAGNVGFVEKFVATEAADMKLATYHYYRGGARNPNATMERLLAHDDPFDLRLTQLQTACTPRHIAYRINEVNSFSGGGKEGISDTFASALWCLDYLFTLAAHGCSGVNMETDINQLGFISFYSPIVHDERGICSARPEYYGMLAFAMAGHGQLLKTTMDKTDIDLSVYATRSENGSICIAAINKDPARDATIEFPLPAGLATAKMYPLQAPSMDAKSNVTLAGADVRPDGTWQAGAAEALTIASGMAHFELQHASAAIAKFERN